MNELRDLYGMVLLDVMRYTSKEDNKVYYNPLLVFSFSKEEKDQVIIPTDIHEPECMSAIRQAITSLGNMFTHVCAEVRVISNIDAEVIETINMNEVMMHNVKEKLEALYEQFVEEQGEDKIDPRTLH